MVQADRQRGYVLGEGFFESNISTIAAPVRDHSGHIVAALGATITSGHIEEDRMDEMVQRVRDTADEHLGPAELLAGRQGRSAADGKRA